MRIVVLNTLNIKRWYVCWYAEVWSCASGFRCAVKVSTRAKTGKNYTMQTETHTHLKTHFHPAQSPWHSSSSPTEMSAPRAVSLPLQLLLEPWREKNPTCHFWYSARRKLVQTTWLGEVQCQGRVKANVGVIRSVKGSSGTSQFTTGCVVIQIQGNIWGLVHVGAHSSHSPLSSDIWARHLLPGGVAAPQTFSAGDALLLSMWVMETEKKSSRCKRCCEGLTNHSAGDGLLGDKEQSVHSSMRAGQSTCTKTAADIQIKDTPNPQCNSKYVPPSKPPPTVSQSVPHLQDEESA